MSAQSRSIWSLSERFVLFTNFKLVFWLSSPSTVQISFKVLSIRETLENSSLVGVRYSMSFSFDSDTSSRISSRSTFSFDSFSSSLPQASLPLEGVYGEV